MLICFHHGKGVIHTEFVFQHHTITGEYRLSVMECLLKTIVRATPEYQEAGSFSRSINNAPFHRRF